jgi:fibronectin-binding autotransporter adhesin
MWWNTLGISGSLNGNFNLNISGPISGGNLTIQPGLRISLSSASNSYTGSTTVFGNATNASNVSLTGAGVLRSIAPIILNNDVQLLLDNTVTNLANRLPDSAPITLNHAALELDGSSTLGVSSAETVGPIFAGWGSNSIVSVQENTSGNTVLTLQSITRSNGATIDFSSGYYALLGASQTYTPKIMITGQAPASFLGGAYTVNLSDFAKYTAAGIVPMAASDYYTGPEGGWNAARTASVGAPVTLTASRIINAVKGGAVNSTNGSISLGGYTLNIVSGGLLGVPVTGTSGSHLTAGGGASSAELFLTYENGTLSANITDNPGPDGQYDPTPGGPLDADNGSVSIVFYGPQFSGMTLTLSGNNTYTGTTYINSGTLTFASANAVPQGNIVVNTGVLSLASNFLANVGALTLRSGYVSLNGYGSVDASSYNLESGQMNIPIVGSGPIQKTTAATVSLGNISNYSGPIYVSGGLLTVSL